jgi:hypothetical protein
MYTRGTTPYIHSSVISCVNVLPVHGVTKVEHTHLLTVIYFRQLLVFAMYEL